MAVKAELRLSSLMTWKELVMTAMSKLMSQSLLVGQMYPFGELTPGVPSPLIQGRGSNDPLEDRSGKTELCQFQTQVLLKLLLKDCTPTMAKSNQKKPIKTATFNKVGAARFRLLRMTDVPLTWLEASTPMTLITKEIQKLTTATKSRRLNECRKKAR
ncbi:hypothetical protein KC357_g109 [Hortaea werneckii]|nr:hypothetical protein KC357_g109 [Hortaea werneckii]